jgi:hypothetical protein
MRYMPFSTPDTLEGFEIFCEDFFRRDPGRCLYVVLDKTKLAPKDETDKEKGTLISQHQYVTKYPTSEQCLDGHDWLY